MVYIELPGEQQRRLSFYLAMEEYVARHVSATDSFFLWQVEPSVIFGRHQVAGQEVDLDYCRRHGIRVYRRKSGGGCVYADEQNLMLSYVTRDDHVALAFNRFVNMLLLVLRRLGVQAVTTRRNDVLIGDRKVSGTACYHLPGCSIVHATLLYDTDMRHMTHAITPPPGKLREKGIRSVRQRITLLKDFIPQSLPELRAHIRSTLCTGTLALGEADVAAICRMEQGYLDEEFLHLL